MLPPLHLKCQFYIIGIVNWGETWTHFGPVFFGQNQSNKRLVHAEATDPMQANVGRLKTWQLTVMTKIRGV
jgi:hypothetical protein